MTTTPEELEKRLAALEQEVSHLRGVVRLLARKLGLEGEVSTAGDGEVDQAEFAAGWLRFLEREGLLREPVGAEKLQEMMRAAGIKAEDNEFSRGIIAMREE